MRRFLPLLAVILAAASMSAAPAQRADGQNLGVLSPRDIYEKQVIMVAPFNVDENIETTLDTIPRIIRRDLELTGWFAGPKDQRLGNQQNIRDGREGRVDFKSWIDYGVEFYAMGRIMRDGASLRVRVLLYDINSQTLIFERFFSDSADAERRLAHRISDEIVRAVRGEQGVAQTQFLFVTEQVPGVKEVAVMDWDGYNPRALTSYNSISTSPEWGANGTEIYFASYKGNRGNIYGMQLSSGQTWTIAGYGGTNHSPSWSQAGRRLAMVLSRDGNSEIYTSKRDGSDLVRMTKSKTTEGSPAWSPDGSKLAYVSDEAAGVHIWVMNADGSGKYRLTPKGSWNDAPTWSPDGTKIAFVSRVKGVNDIFLADLGGGAPQFRRLTENQGQNASPVWAPNSRHVAFASNRSGSYQIFIMLDDGSNQQQITAKGRNSQPSWGPLPSSAKGE